jgi:hypothetical protein
MVHFFVRLLLIITLACALNACGIAIRAETSTTTSVIASLNQKQAPSCRRYGLCRGMFDLYQPYTGDDIAHQHDDGQFSAR